MRTFEKIRVFEDAITAKLKAQLKQSYFNQ
jgi:hypothetical protein